MPCGVACSSSWDSHQIGSATLQKLPLTPAHPALSATIETIVIQRIHVLTYFTRSLLCLLIGFQLIDAGFCFPRRLAALPDRKKSRKGGYDGGDVGPDAAPECLQPDHDPLQRFSGRMPRSSADRTFAAASPLVMAPSLLASSPAFCRYVVGLLALSHSTASSGRPMAAGHSTAM